MLSNRISLGLVIDSNQTDLNLHDYAGNPSPPADVSLLVTAGVEINTMVFGGWAPGTIINWTHLGRVRGRGGNPGGDGGWAEGGSAGPGAGPGVAGGAGGHAIVLPGGIVVNIDADDGYLWGGGGAGGGGGAAVYNSAPYYAASGGGGGGGQGWNDTSGGLAGNAVVANSGLNGAGGSASGAGLGGIGATNSEGVQSGNGGNGAAWGAAGNAGQAGYTTLGVTARAGGAAGAAGRAVQLNGSTVNFTGTKDLAALQAENRVLGAIS